MLAATKAIARRNGTTIPTAYQFTNPVSASVPIHIAIGIAGYNSTLCCSYPILSSHRHHSIHFLRHHLQPQWHSKPLYDRYYSDPPSHRHPNRFLHHHWLQRWHSSLGSWSVTSIISHQAADAIIPTAAICATALGIRSHNSTEVTTN